MFFSRKRNKAYACIIEKITKPKNIFVVMVNYVNAENVVKKRQNECVVDLVQDEVGIKQPWEEI